MRTGRCASRKPPVVSVILLVVLLGFGQQAEAQLSLLNSVVSTTTNVVSGTLSAATGLVGGLLDKLSGDLQVVVGGPAGQQVQVIVQTTTAPSSSDLGLLQLLGGILKTTYSGSITGYSATLTAGAVLQLAGNANVERISLDSPVRAHLDIAWRAVHGDRVAATTATGGGLDGRGVGIALIDTGVQLHPDFKRSILSKPIVEVEIVGHEAGLADYYGHGTHVAGILYGNGFSSSDSLSFRTFRGLAPGAQLISVRALSPDGTGLTSDIITGIEWVIKYASSYNIRVLNLSLGHPVYESYRTDPLCRAVAAAVRKGIVVVVAAGNDGGVGTGFGTITSPGNSPVAVTVGAIDDRNTVPTGDDVLAWYSSKGPSLVDFVVKPDLVAPGSWIVSARAVSSWLDTQHHELTLQIGDYKNDPAHATDDGAYYSLSGTSMAAPFVAGAAALMVQKDPSLNPATVKARLMKSAAKDTRLVFESGAGFLDVEAAVNATGYAQSAPSPLAMAADDGFVYFQDTAILWGSSWTEGAIWGTGKGSAAGATLTAVPGSISSGSGAIWGGNGGARSIIDNSSVSASGAIWGGGRASMSATTGTVTSDGAIWGGDGGGYRK